MRASAGLAVAPVAIQLFRVGLVLRARLVERGKRKAGGVHRDHPGEAVERNLEPSRVGDLRHEADVGERDARAERVGPGLKLRLEGFERGSLQAVKRLAIP